jgi:hypothetical protein
MDLAEHFTNFYETILDDPRISPVHIGLYMALLLAFEQNKRNNPIPVQRNGLMKRAKINATSTYYTVMKELKAYGYIQYKPSLSPYGGSLVYLRKI